MTSQQSQYGDGAPTFAPPGASSIESGLNAAGLKRLASSVGATRVRPLGPFRGGVSSLTDAVAIEYSGAERLAVVKRFTPGSAVAPNVDSSEWASFEWERLRFARRCAIRTPEPLSLDVDGSWFGLPAILMSRVSGSPRSWHESSATLLEGLAATLHAIHATPFSLGEAPETLRRPHLAQTWRPEMYDSPHPLTPRCSRVIDELRHQILDAPVVLTHGDYHAGNVLFDDGVVSGVVDWSAARIAPALADIAHCAAYLSMSPGGSSRARFLALYGQTESPSLKQWEVLFGVHFINQLDVRRPGLDLNEPGQKLADFMARTSSRLEELLDDLGA